MTHPVANRDTFECNQLTEWTEKQHKIELLCALNWITEWKKNVMRCIVVWSIGSVGISLIWRNGLNVMMGESTIVLNKRVACFTTAIFVRYHVYSINAHYCLASLVYWQIKKFRVCHIKYIFFSSFFQFILTWSMPIFAVVNFDYDLSVHFFFSLFNFPSLYLITCFLYSFVHTKMNMMWYTIEAVYLR